MRKYPIESNSGKIDYYNYIGVNHDASGVKTDGVISAYNKLFDNLDEILLENKKICTLGDIKEAYQLLKNEIVAKGSCNLYQYAECIQRAVSNYFSDYSNSKNKKGYVKINNEDNKYQISDLAHKNIASSVDKAVVAQNLLMEIGINSSFKISGVMINGKEDIHAYNLISFDKKFYIFDTDIPSFNNNRINPIICEIPTEVYYWIANPTSNIGYSVHVNHYNPLTNLETDIIYDAGRDFIYNIDKQDAKVIK